MNHREHPGEASADLARIEEPAGPHHGGARARGWRAAALACAAWGCSVSGGGDGTATSTGGETSASSSGDDSSQETATTGGSATTGPGTTAPTEGGSSSGTGTESSSGGPEGPCRDLGCHYECYDEDTCEFDDHDPTPWQCDLPEICPGVGAGESFEETAYREAAHCLMQALRDGTVGLIHFNNVFPDGELGDIGPEGRIHVLPGRTVVIDYTRLASKGLGSGCWHPQRSKVLDIAPADLPLFADCLQTDDIAMLQACTGIGYPKSPIDFPWLAGTCAESTDACP